MTGLLKAIGSVNSIWSLAAFTIAAVLILVSTYARRTGSKGETAAGSARTIWIGAAAICLVGLAPIMANSFLETQRTKAAGVYRVRVTVLDASGIPLSGVRLRATASNETTVTGEGDAVLAIPRGSMPADGKVTIFAEKPAEFLHGSGEIRLADDPNPSLSIHVIRDASASVTGRVQDADGQGVRDASVSIAGAGEVKTSENGTFELAAHAAPGQSVTLHVEKSGYGAVDQSHLAGSEPATIVLARLSRP